MASSYCPIGVEVGGDGSDPRRWREFVRAVLADGCLFLEYQEIKLREPLGLERYEALARLRDGPKIIPARFWIDAVAEDAVLSRVLDWHIIYLQFSTGIPRGRQVWLNLTAHTLCEGDFIERLEVALERYGIAPEQVAIELTEQAASRPGCLGALADLQERCGVGAVIDDLGAGYSCLEALATAKIIAFKLDGALIQLQGTPRGSDLIMVFAWLARRWGILCIAERVETTEQAQALWLKGLGGLQGYGISRIYLSEDFS